MIDIKKAIANNSLVTFSHYVDKQLWYQTVQGDCFPVPIEDLGTATLYPSEKAILYMRYMRKWNEVLNNA
jgi:hypothetical protein